MGVLTAEEIAAALGSGYELRGLELKGPGPRTDAHLFAKVTRAALSMGNLRDGGHVIIGVDDGDPRAMLPGLDAMDLASWMAYDDVARKLAEYADPPLRFDIGNIELSSGVIVAVVQVFEFSDIPHLCAKDYPQVLRKGALYVRPRKGVEAPDRSRAPVGARDPAPFGVTCVDPYQLIPEVLNFSLVLPSCCSVRHQASEWDLIRAISS